MSETITDKDGKWIKDGEVKYLVEPSAEYLAKLPTEKIKPITNKDSLLQELDDPEIKNKIKKIVTP